MAQTEDVHPKRHAVVHDPAALARLLAGTGRSGSPALNRPHQDRPWSDPALSPDARAALVVDEMTEDEKFAWLSQPVAIPINGATIPDEALGSAACYPSIPRLGIPAMQQADASLGVGNLGNVRPGDTATALPSSLLLGATFDTELAYETGALVGREARAKGFNVQLAGGANLIREPRGGRNFEYVSEDPLLTGLIAGHSVAGIQAQGVVSTVKHFVANAQETGRVLISSDLSEAAMRESDLLAFQIAIEIGQPGAVMPGYNLVNGTYASENAHLINDVLKGDWAYPGWVMSDWGAVHSTEKAALAALDVQSGSNLDTEPFFGEPLREAVRGGQVPQARIDDMVRRQLRSLFAAGVVDNPPMPGGPIDYSAHRLLAQRAAEHGIVLLKNDGGALPLAKGAKRLLVIGRRADVGVLCGGGSSAVAPIGSLHEEGVALTGGSFEKIYQPSAPLRAIEVEANAAEVEFLDGRDVAAAVAAARGADAVIVIAEEWRSEGRDAAGLSLPDEQDALIEAVSAAHPKVIVAIESGGPVTMPWLATVPAVLAIWYPGHGGGEALAGVLFGRVNPSGRLPITFPADEGQLPRPEQRDPETTTSNPGMPLTGEVFHVSYDIEGSDVGYRWYEREGLVPLFPFGHGLSYTAFEATDLTVHADDDTIAAAVTIRNSGPCDGIETAQFYASREGEDGFMSRLVAFTRIRLAPGESRRVEMEVDPRLVARFDVERNGWHVASGLYRIRVGENAHAPGLATTVDLRERCLPA